MKQALGMLNYLLRPLRQLFAALASNDSSNQLAWGFTLGMVLGMVPKGNLIAIAAVVVLFALRVNRSTGLLAAGIFSLISPHLDGMTHKIGESVLYQPGLQPFYAWLYNQPFGPFIGFHNTVTIGSLLFALYITYPCYYGSRVAFERLGPPLARYVAQYRLGRKVLGLQLAAQWRD